MTAAVPGVLVLMGPTASGKTAVAEALAAAFDAELVGADSRQIYAGMPIGTAAPALRPEGPRYHLVGFLDRRERYSAARFATEALAAIDDIHARGKRAIVVGGTGFYIRALLGETTLANERDEVLRERLAREVAIHPPAVLHAWLAALDPARAANVRPNDPYRITRALEIALTRRDGDGAPRAAAPQASLRSRGIAYRKIALDLAPERAAERIAARTDAMLAAGFVAEAEAVGADVPAANAVGYPEALAYLAGFASFEELRGRLARATRSYAKRQRTWLRGERDLLWIDAADLAAATAAAAREARTLPQWV
jgi:tRNA dimethylallyltransferase